eukprot:gene27251-48798_t
MRRMPIHRTPPLHALTLLLLLGLSQTTLAKPAKLQTLTNSLGMTLVRIP